MTDPMTEIENLKGMTDVAKMTAAFYRELRDQGVDRRDAAMLTATWLNAMIMRPTEPSEPEE